MISEESLDITITKASVDGKPKTLHRRLHGLPSDRHWPRGRRDPRAQLRVVAASYQKIPLEYLIGDWPPPAATIPLDELPDDLVDIGEERDRFAGSPILYMHPATEADPPRPSGVGVTRFAVMKG